MNNDVVPVNIKEEVLSLYEYSYYDMQSKLKEYNKIHNITNKYYRSFNPCYGLDKSSVSQNFDKAPVISIASFHKRYGNQIIKWAAELGIDPAALGAICFKESNGWGFVAGEVKIRFETRVFNEGTSNKHSKAIQSKPRAFYANGKWNTINPSNITKYEAQKNEHIALNIAAKLDEDQAYASASYGLGQVMGGNYTYLSALDIMSAQDLYNVSSEGMSSQIDIMAVFIRDNPYKKKNAGYKPLLQLLKDRDYDNFARLYNGSINYNRGEYSLEYWIKEYRKAMDKS